MSELLPLFVKLDGRRVLLVGGGRVAASKLTQLLAAGADVSVIAPEIRPEIESAGVTIARRGFVPSDLDDVWLAVAAATPTVNREVAEAADTRHVFVNAVDDPSNASAFLSGVVRRDGVTLAISTSGDAPGLTALVREALDAVLPRELDRWMDESRRQRAIWKRDGVPMAARRPLLLEALNRLYDSGPQRGTAETPSERGGRKRRRVEDGLEQQRVGGLEQQRVGDGLEQQRLGDGLKQQRGHVSLVGAGPGDPGLLTRHAVARLRGADLVLYDALVDQRVLRLARKAQRFFVGKRAGRHALSQTAIHAVMIRAARRGRRVVRLKGGDPFVFGRGGEEALALKRARVPFDIVPGVTSAVAAPALAGIPVTHRGVASAFLVVSGHDEQAFAASIGALTPNDVTVVVLMGLARRAALASALIDRGWAPGIPAALVAEASLPQQEVWRGSLGDLAAGLACVESDGPALLVVGDVVGLELLAETATDESEHVGRVLSEHVDRVLLDPAVAAGAKQPVRRRG